MRQEQLFERRRVEAGERLDELGLDSQVAVDRMERELLRVVVRGERRLQLRRQLRLQTFPELLEVVRALLLIRLVLEKRHVLAHILNDGGGHLPFQCHGNIYLRVFARNGFFTRRTKLIPFIECLQLGLARAHFVLNVLKVGENFRFRAAFHCSGRFQHVLDIRLQCVHLARYLDHFV